ncbi:ATP-binding cassette domain-containing protein [Mesorhizobium sp. M0854]|uniref:ATP-binding cassette domain-containing protein n=1 Tax=unclassified Mesorhizobium TaxID=325217 RepID=UPI00333877A6
MQHVRTSGAGEEVAALDVAGVSHSYGPKRALQDVSFSIAPGTFTVLLGLNGAGKTTLFSLISHLYGTRRGSIRIFGYDVSRASGEALRRVGIVFQARTLDLDLSVHQNLSYHASLHGIGGHQVRQRIAALLETVNMQGRQHDKARSLSGGQMRRIEIARALLHRPSLLLLDEATVGLDIQSRAGILATIRKLVETEGIGVLWATHLIDEVEDGDHVVVLRQGDLVAKGKVADVVATSGASSIRDAFSRLNRIETSGIAEMSP